MAKFQMDEVLNYNSQIDTARLADGSGDANQLAEADVGKFVRLKAGSQYGLCAAGDEIEGVVDSSTGTKMDGFNVGGVRKNGRVKVTLDGLQATPGTGTIDVGDYVVCGTVVARGTALGSGVYPKVCKSTDLTFATTPAVNFPAGSQLKHKWRVVHRYGTTAVGQTALIERVEA